MSEVTKRIDNVLNEKGIAKKDFYSDCGVTSSAYSQWNTGKTEPRKATLRKVAEYLGVNYEWLAFGSGEKEKAPTLASESGQPVNIVRIAGRDGSYTEKRLTDEQIKALQTIIDQMPEAPDYL